MNDTLSNYTGVQQRLLTATHKLQAYGLFPPNVRQLREYLGELDLYDTSFIIESGLEFKVDWDKFSYWTRFLYQNAVQIRTYEPPAGRRKNPKFGKWKKVSLEEALEAIPLSWKPNEVATFKAALEIYEEYRALESEVSDLDTEAVNLEVQMVKEYLTEQWTFESGDEKYRRALDMIDEDADEEDYQQVPWDNYDEMVNDCFNEAIAYYTQKAA